MQIKAENSEALQNIIAQRKAVEQLQASNASLKAQNKELSKSMEELAKAGKDNTAEYKKQEKQLVDNKAAIAANSEAVKASNREIAENSRLIQNNIRASKENTDSILALRGKLSSMKQEYYSLSKAQRENADVGGAMQKQIKELTDEISAAEQSVGVFSRNVGNYENSINSAIGANKGIIGQFTAMQAQAAATGQTFGGVLMNGIRSAAGALKALLANPVVLILASIVASVTAVTKVIKGNEEQTRRLQKLFAPLQRGLAAITNVVQQVVDVLITAMEWVGKFAGGISKALEKLPFVGKYIQQANEATSAAIKLEEDKQKLQDATRQNTLDQAKTEEKVADLRAKIAQKDKYSSEERIKMSDEAAQAEKEQAERNIALAEERLRIAKIEAEYNKNSKEVNDELIQLEAEVIRRRTETSKRLKEIEGERQAAVAAIAAEQKSADDAKLKREQEYQKLVSDGQKKIRDLTLDLMEEGQEKELAIRQRQYEEELKQVQGTDKQKAEIRTLLEEQYERDTQAIRDKYSQEALDKAVEARKKELEIMLQLAEGDADKQLAIKIRQWEIEKQEAIKAAEETGVAVDLVEAQFEQRRRDMEADAEEARKEARASRLQEYMESITEQYSHELELYEGNEQAKTAAQLEIEQSKLDALLSMTEEQKASMFESEEAYQQAVRDQIMKTTAAEVSSAEESKKARLAAIKDAQAKMDSLNEVAGGISDIFNQIAGDNEQMQGFLKAVALFQIGVDMAKAIAGAVAGAMTQPFPANIAAVVSGIAAVTAGIVQAKQTLSKQKEATAPKFATGGLVSGEGTGTSDSIPAMLSNGESVINARSTAMFAPLLSSINQAGGGIPIQMEGAATQSMGEEYMSESIAAAMRMMPNPVVSVQEITDVSGRVAVLETLRNR